MTPERGEGKSEGGFWRWLAIGVSAFVVLGLVIDTINLKMSQA